MAYNTQGIDVTDSYGGVTYCKGNHKVGFFSFKTGELDMKPGATITDADIIVADIAGRTPDGKAMRAGRLARVQEFAANKRMKERLKDAC